MVVDHRAKAGFRQLVFLCCGKGFSNQVQATEHLETVHGLPRAAARVQVETLAAPFKTRRVAPEETV